MFKITAAPFHMWAPDVYEGAPTIVSTFFAVVPKIAILGFLLRFLVTSFYDLADFWQQHCIFIIIINGDCVFSCFATKKTKTFFCL